MATDEQLIKQIKEGKSEEFGQLFRKYYGKIYSICLSMLKNPDDAEEITSDTFVSAYLKIDQLSIPDKFFPWLKKIARNRSKDFLRSKRREAVALSHSVPTMQKTTHDFVLAQKTTHDFVLAQENPDILVLKQELIDAIMEAIESLPAKDREVIQARIDGLNHSQISEKLSISISASMNRLYRAKKKIAAHIKNLLNCIIGLPKTLPLEKIVSGGIEAMKAGTSKEVTTGVIAAMQSLMFSVIFHIALFISLSFFLPYKFHSDRQKADVYMEVALIPAEEHQSMQRLPKREAKPAIPVKSSLPPVKKASPKSSPRGFLSAKKLVSQGEIGGVVSKIGQGMRELQIGSGVSVKSGERILSGNGKGEEIIPTAGVGRGLEVGKGDVGLTDRVSEIAKGRSGVALEMNKVERLKPVTPQRENFSKQAGLSMLDDVGAADADDTLANVTKDMIMGRTGFGVPKLPKGEPGGIVVGRGRDIRGYLRIPRVDCSMVDRYYSQFRSQALPNLMRWMNANTNIKLNMNVEGGGIPLTDVRLLDAPLIFIFGYDHMGAHGIEAGSPGGYMKGWDPSPGLVPARASSRLTDSERKSLRKYLVDRGGILVVDTASRINTPSKDEYPWSKKMRKELRRVLPEYPMKRIPNDHELYYSYYALGGPPPGMITIASILGPIAYARQPYLEGVFINGRLGVIYCQEGYAGMMVMRKPSIFRMMTNIVVYALTHSGISDKSRYVPQKEIKESAEEIPKKPPFIPQATPNSRR